MYGDILAAVKESVHDIAITMLSVDISPVASEQPSFDSSYEPIDSEICCLIEFSGDVVGGLRFASSEPAIFVLVGSFMGMMPESMDEDTKDAFAELTNMIAGGVQAAFLEIYGQSGGDVNISPPQVSFDGPLHKTDENADSVRQKFEVEGESFFIEVFYAH
ncbi:chemotaxis protein CheX [Magnetococcales bacterium HHB-1]